MHGTGIMLLVFVCIAFVIGAVVRFSLKKASIPYTVVLLLIGLAIGSASRLYLADGSHTAGGQIMSLIAQMDPHLILYLFLPALIFESAFAMDTHLFKRMFGQICLLAIPGLIIATAMTAAFAIWQFPWQWTWPIALMFGALVSATDPVAVVALLKEQSSRKRMETLIEGESLLNDGTAIVLFTLFYGLTLTSLQQPGSLEVGFLAVAGQFIWVVLLGVAIGGLIGWLCINWLGKIFNDDILEIVITIVAAYLAFIVAEGMFHVSGIVAVVTMALIFASAGKTRFSPEVQHSLHHFWEVLSYLFNTMIFLLVGILIAELVEFNKPEYWWMLGLLYVAVQLIRLISIGLLSPLLSRFATGITKEKATVLVWGGLRGAVALALALAVAQTEAIPIEIRQQILFLTSGLVVLSILFNGGSMKLLMAKLGLDKLPAGKQRTVDTVISVANNKVYELALQMKDDPYLKLADWSSILPEPDPNKATNTDSSASASTEQISLTVEELKEAFFRQLLEAEKQHYWRQFQRGELLPDCHTILNQSVQRALDGSPVLASRGSLMQFWQNTQKSLIARLGINGDSQRKSRLDKQINIYNSCQGFRRSQEFCLSQIAELAPNKELANIANDAIRSNLKLVQTHLSQFEQEDQAQVKLVQTYIARKLLLNRERAALHEAIEQGVIESSDGEKLIEQVESKMQQLQDRGV